MPKKDLGKPALTFSYVMKVADKLVERIDARFKEDPITEIARDVSLVCKNAESRLARAKWASFFTRVVTWPVVIGAATGLVYLSLKFELKLSITEAGQAAQVLDSVFQILIVLGALTWFLLGLSSKVLRSRMLTAVAELNTLAQVVDLLQLDKDPERLTWKSSQQTDVSPTLGEAKTAFLLSRYLDYCTELLSIVDKVGSLYSRSVDDEIVLVRLGALQGLTNDYRANLAGKLDLIHLSEKVSAEVACPIPTPTPTPTPAPAEVVHQTATQAATA